MTDVTRTIQTFYDTLTAWRDPNETHHGGEVARLSEQIGQLLDLPEHELILLKVAAHLHDLGKVGLPESLLNKNGRYTRPEHILAQLHTQIGVDLLRPFRLGPIIYDVVLHHHERADGQGYPHQLRAETIPIHAAIVGIADVYDALTHERPYRMAMAASEALHVIKSDPGAHSPQVLEAFLEAVRLSKYEQPDKAKPAQTSPLRNRTKRG